MHGKETYFGSLEPNPNFVVVVLPSLLVTVFDLANRDFRFE